MIREPGKLAKVDHEDRLSIPLPLLRSVEWWNDESAETIAELVSSRGLVRLYLAELAEPTIQTLASDLAELGAEDEFVLSGALADRFRPLKLYADGRLRFTKEVAQILGFSLGDEPTLFVQNFPAGLEIMSLDYRAKILDDPNQAISLNLHLTESSD